MRERTPIFNRLAERYRSPDLTTEDFVLKAFMRGFLYGLVLKDAFAPPPAMPIVLDDLQRRRGFSFPYYSMYLPVVSPRVIVNITP